jgi:drug/metabolite transporter (DMT)-like permease
MSLSFVLMLPVSRYFFNETVTPYKAVGSLLIVAGVICTALGSLRIKQEGRDW